MRSWVSALLTLVSHTIARRSGSGYGSGRSTTRSSTREDGGGGADAERQRQHGRDGESRRAAQEPEAEADILKQSIHARELDGHDGRRVVRARAGWASMQKILDDSAGNQMFLDDPLEHRRIAVPVPGALGIDDRDRAAFADAQAVRLGAQDAALLGQAQLLQPAPSGNPTPRGRDPSRSISASSDRSRERCAGARPARRCSAATSRCESLRRSTASP